MQVLPMHLYYLSESMCMYACACMHKCACVCVCVCVYALGSVRVCVSVCAVVCKSVRARKESIRVCVRAHICVFIHL